MATRLAGAHDIQPGKAIFLPPERTNYPFDVVLVVENGREFKAHRDVLSEGSPFFEKLLNGDMKEAKEGIARLQMLTESGLSDILEFIYTDSVQISAEGNAHELIEMANYFLLPQLKTRAESVLVENLAQKLNASNCLSTYFFAERHHCEQLIFNTKEFIFANFSNVVKTEDFLSMSRKEVEMWIASDEIDVSSEGDVFKIILAWIDLDKSERRKYFADLFRQVRLFYVSRDFMNSDIATNDLVKDNEVCMNLVKHTMMLLDSNVFDVSVTPRKSLETPVIVVSVQEQILCYFPRNDTWCRLHCKAPVCRAFYRHGQLRFSLNERESRLLSYNRMSNSFRYDLIKLGDEVHRETEIYALMSTKGASDYEFVSLQPFRRRPPVPKTGLVDHPLGSKVYAPQSDKTRILDLYTIMKDKPKLNLWEDLSIDLGLRVAMCVVSKGRFIDFLGDRNFLGRFLPYSPISLTDTESIKGDNVAETQQVERQSCGSVACKTFLTGSRSVEDRYRFFERSRKVYNETTRESQWIANLRKTCACQGFMVCVDDKIYILGICRDRRNRRPVLKIECYNPDSGEWHQKTGVPISSPSQSETLDQSSSVPDKEDRRTKEHNKRECLIT